MASFVTNEYRLDITPQGNYPVIYLSQFEDARQIRFKLLNRGSSFTIPNGISVFISGLKSNGGYYEHTCSIDETRKYVTVSIADDMVDAKGRGVANLVFANSSNEKVISAKFITNVQESVSDTGAEIPTAAQTVFQQLLDEIRTAATALDVDIAVLQSTIDTFTENTTAEIDNFEEDVNADIAAVDARMDTFISTHSGVIPSATKVTQTTLYNYADTTGIGSYVTLSDDPRNYDFIIIVYGMYFNSAFKKLDRAIVSGADLYNTSLSNPFICSSFGMFDAVGQSIVSDYPLRAMQLWMYRYATDASADRAFRTRFSRLDWAGMANDGAYGEGWETNDCMVKTVYGLKFTDATVDKDAELIDARVGFDGTTYETAGTAIRSQISTLNTAVENNAISISGTCLYIGEVEITEDVEEQTTSNPSSS